MGGVYLLAFLGLAGYKVRLHDIDDAKLASVRNAGVKVANASTCNGMNTIPSPKPCNTMVVMMSCCETSGVHPVMM